MLLSFHKCSLQFSRDLAASSTSRKPRGRGLNTSRSALASAELCLGELGLTAFGKLLNRQFPHLMLKFTLFPK